MECRFNHFVRKKNETVYVLNEGVPIFSESMNALVPNYIHKRSPALTLVSKGKFITALFSIAETWKVGNFKGQSVLIFTREDDFDIFLIDIHSKQIKPLLLSGELNDTLFKARKSI